MGELRFGGTRWTSVFNYVRATGHGKLACFQSAAVLALPKIVCRGLLATGAIITVETQYPYIFHTNVYQIFWDNWATELVVIHSLADIYMWGVFHSLQFNSKSVFISPF